MSKSPFQSWLTVQEHKSSYSIFLVEWLSIFVLAWMFWSLMFFWAPGAFISPKIAATVVAVLYATCVVYGRLLKATGCRKCPSPWPFLRKEIGRRHLQDEEDCMEVQYGGDAYGQDMVQVYCRTVCHDIVTYRCRKCNKVWEEKIQLPGSTYRLVRRIDP